MYITYLNEHSSDKNLRRRDKIHLDSDHDTIIDKSYILIMYHRLTGKKLFVLSKQNAEVLILSLKIHFVGGG